MIHHHVKMEEPVPTKEIYFHVNVLKISKEQPVKVFANLKFCHSVYLISSDLLCIFQKNKLKTYLFRLAFKIFYC